MSIQHTPGPWSADFTIPNTGAVRITAADGETAAWATGEDGVRTRPESLANANLIAKAPELLASLYKTAKAAVDLADWTQRLDEKLIKADGRDPAKEPVLGELRKMAEALVEARALLKSLEVLG